MSEQDLKKLNRAALLELLVEQSKALNQLRDELAHSEEIKNELVRMIRENNQTLERLKERLNQKDAQIAEYEAQSAEFYEQVEKRLKSKNTEIRTLEKELAVKRAGKTVAEASSPAEARRILDEYLKDAERALKEYSALTERRR